MKGYDIYFDEPTFNILKKMNDPSKYINSLINNYTSQDKHIKALEKKEQQLLRELEETRNEINWFETMIKKNGCETDD